MLSNIGVPGLILVINFIIGVFILYIVIVTAVKNGINKSVVGKFIEKNMGSKTNSDNEK